MSGRGRGRGWYYKEKYGGGRGGGRGGRGGAPRDPSPHESPAGAGAGGTAAGTSHDLERTLHRIDGAGYKAYHDIQGSWAFPSFTLHVDWIQSDPYAAPSRCRVTVPPGVAGFPEALHATPVRKMALCDFLARRFGGAVRASGGDARAGGGGWHGEKGGDMAVEAPGQHVLERSSVIIHPDGAVEGRFTVGLPARGRSVLGDWAATVLVRNLPRYVQAGLIYSSFDPDDVARHVACVEDGDALRRALRPLGLVAFVADGAVLPRASGASDAPMPAADAVPFASPPSLALEIELPNSGRVRGMGLRRGVTLICGGGFHGKSTLLEALQAGVYPKIPGDGRELVATDAGAVKVRAEDGRRVAAVDISPYIANLPLGRDTQRFSSTDASGSTSQAASIQEAVEAGAAALLIDEDTSATNFMVRDARMAELVAPAKEPIRPYVTRVRALAAAGVSTLLVVGGTGEYFGEADTVIALDSYAVADVTAQAHAIAARHGAAVLPPPAQPYPPVPPRTLVGLRAGEEEGEGAKNGAPHRDSREIRCKTRGLGGLTLDDVDLDLGGIEQLVEVGQTRAVGEALLRLRRGAAGAWRGLPLAQALDCLEAEMDAAGLDALVPGGGRPGNLARPRRFEIAAAINRLRSAEVRQV